LSPALLLASTFAILGILEAAETTTVLPALPSAVFLFAPQVIGLLGVLALQGAIVPAVMHTIVSPLEPIDPRNLRAVFGSRMRAYIKGIAPLIGMMTLYFGWVLLVSRALPALLAPYREVLRQYPRPLVIAGVMMAILLLTAGPMVLFRKSEGGASLQFLGSVAMIEGLHGREAMRRSALLARASGRALQAVMIASFAIGAVFGLSLAAVVTMIPRDLPAWAFGTIAANLLTLCMIFLAPVLSVVSALAYLRALKAAGESPNDVLRRFEREVLPPSHWSRAARERILTQIDATRG
jgi:hypothetical protein